jgi:hypothetical protein
VLIGSRRSLINKIDGILATLGLERLPAKWMQVRVKKTRKNKELEPRSDSIGSEKALEG